MPNTVHIISQGSINIIQNSLAKSTQKQYESIIKHWHQFCIDTNINPTEATHIHGIEFLTKLFYESGIGYSAINSARSALSLVIKSENGITFGNQNLVKRYMKGVFRLRPALPRYPYIYDAGKVLAFLDTIKNESCSLKDLSAKLVMLLLLVMGQRNQSLASIDINCIRDNNDIITIFIPTILKQTKPGHHLEPIRLVTYPYNINLCPVSMTRQYLQKTENLRTTQNLLFVSYVKPHNSVKPATLARWAKTILLQAGIDVGVFSAHSTRAASTSKASVSMK